MWSSFWGPLYDEDLEELYKSQKPDILLWLVLLPTDKVVSIINTYCYTYNVPILILAVVFDEASFYTLLNVGIRGYFCTSDDADLLANAIRTIAKGDKWYSPSIAAHLLQQRMSKLTKSMSSNHGNNLTEREVDILQMVAQGWGNQKIGQALGVTERTVRSHMRNIYDKLHLANRAEAIAWTLKSGCHK